MGSRLYLPPHPPLGFIPEVVQFMGGDKTFHTAREVFSHIDLLFVGQGESESWVKIVSGL